MSYAIKRLALEDKISFNEKIKCHRVAERYRRELRRLNAMYPEEAEKYEHNAESRRGIFQDSM